MAGVTVWLTGLPAAGKTTLAAVLADNLAGSTRPVSILDGDVLRRGMNAGLGFSLNGRTMAAQRAGERALALAREGHVVLVAMVSPLIKDRAAVRELHNDAAIAFLEVWVAAPLAVCEKRDPKGLYRRAREGRLTNMTGMDSPYEPPPHPEVVVATELLSPAQAAERVLAALNLQP